MCRVLSDITEGNKEIEQDRSIVRVLDVTGHCGRQQDRLAGRPHQQTVQGLNMGQVEEALWGHVDIVQASMLDPVGRPRAGFGDGSWVVVYFVVGML